MSGLNARIAQGRGAAPADLVDQERAPVRPRHRRARRRPISRSAATPSSAPTASYRGAREIDGARAHRRAGLHRHPSACRILAGHAARVRPLRAAARRHDGDLRPARDRQRRSAPTAFDYFLACVRAHGHGPARAALELRAGDRAGDLGRAARGRRPAALSRPSQGDRARRVHELPRRARRRSRRASPSSRPSRTAISTAMRRCCAARDLNGYLAAGIRTDHETTERRRGAARRSRKGMTVLIREGSVSKDLAGAGRPAHGRDLALPRALHRRPQPARHRRGGPSRPHDPHADRAAAARRSRSTAPPR